MKGSIVSRVTGGVTGKVLEKVVLDLTLPCLALPCMPQRVQPQPWPAAHSAPLGARTLRAEPDPVIVLEVTPHRNLLE